MFSSIPQKRLIFYLILVALLPTFVVLINHLQGVREFKRIAVKLEETKSSLFSQESRQAINLAVRDHFRHADHHYVDHQLESLTFLEPEIESLQRVIRNKNFAGDEDIKGRLTFLTSPANRLLFADSDVVTTPLVSESVVSLVHPVEMNIEDFKELLARVEGVAIDSHLPPPGRPQLIILDLKSEKRKKLDNNEVFEVTLSLLKREYPR